LPPHPQNVRLDGAAVNNGYFGYLPPPDQHKLGGYTTWRARTSMLEVEAEPKIAAAVLELLQNVANQRADEKLRASQESS
jgi:hypothetical protein